MHRSIMRKKLFFGIFALMFLLVGTGAWSYEFSENINIIIFTVDDNADIIDIKVVRDNPFYRTSNKYKSIFDIPDDYVEGGRYIELLNKERDILESAEFHANFYLFYYEDISKIIVYDEYGEHASIIFEKELNFCNNNNICEPCEGIDCSLSENSVTCADCGSGSSDLYCDLKKDGKCDPDCNNLDMDCPGCTEDRCYYEDSMDQMNMCSDFGGEICVTFEECAGDVIDYSDEGYCCMGFCVDPSVDEEYIVEEVEVEEFYYTDRSDPQGQDVGEIVDPVVLFNMNYDDTIPVEDETGKIYCSDVGKSTCEYLEECLGERVYSDDEGYDCCTGECAPLSDKEFDEVYEGVFGEKYTEIPAEEIILPEEVPEEFIFGLEIKKASPLWLLLLIIPVVVIIFLFNVIKKKKTGREKRLEYEYNYYKRYGYSNEQMKKILRDRGWKKEEIKKVMKK